MKNEIMYYGDVVCAEWFNHILKSNGAPDYLAINVLSRIAHLYTPTKKIIDGVVVECKRYESDMPQIKYSDLAERFNCSKKSIQRALVTLESTGLIERIYRTIDTGKNKLFNAMYIHLNIPMLNKISHGIDEQKPELNDTVGGITNNEIATIEPHNKKKNTPVAHSYTEEEKAHYSELLNKCGSAGIIFPDNSSEPILTLTDSKLMDKPVHTNTYNNINKCVKSINITITTYNQLIHSQLLQYVSLDWLINKVTQIIHKVNIAIDWSNYLNNVHSRLTRYLKYSRITDIYKYVDRILNNDISEHKLYKYIKKRPEQIVRSS